MSNPKLSVIVPCYNAEKTISVSIASLLRQSEKDTQIILIDDQSTDRTRQILDRYAASDRRIDLFVNERNIGVADTKNIGLENAIGTYVGFLDADDWVHPHYFENLVDLCDRLNVDFVRCDHVRVSNQKRWVETAPQLHKYEKLIPRNSIGPSSKKTMIDYPYAGAGVFRNDVLKKLEIQFQNGLRSAEDRLFFLRLFYESSSYSVAQENGYFYRKETNKTLTTNGNESQLHVFKAIFAMLTYCKENVKEFDIRLKVTEMSLALIHFHALNRDRLNSDVKVLFRKEIHDVRPAFEVDLFRRVMETTTPARRKDLGTLFKQASRM